MINQVFMSTKDDIILGYDVVRQSVSMMNDNWPFAGDAGGRLQAIRDRYTASISGRRLSGGRAEFSDFSFAQLLRDARNPNIRTQTEFIQLTQQFVTLLQQLGMINFQFFIAALIFLIGAWWTCAVWDGFTFEIIKRALLIEHTQAFAERFPELAIQGKGSDHKMMTTRASMIKEEGKKVAPALDATSSAETVEADKEADLQPVRVMLSDAMSAPPPESPGTAAQVQARLADALTDLPPHQIQKLLSEESLSGSVITAAAVATPAASTTSKVHISATEIEKI